MKNYKEQLLDRLTDNSIRLCIIGDSLRHHPVGRYLTEQLVRSGTATSLIYAESISAESIKDLIHKLGLVLKELRETKTNLSILSGIKLDSTNSHLVESSIIETEELIAQIAKSLYTLKVKHRDQSKGKK